MNKKQRIYKELFRCNSDKNCISRPIFYITKIIFTRTKSKKCSGCKFGGGLDRCREFDIILNGEVVSLYRFCSRNKSLNNGSKGRYILHKIQRC